MAQNMEDESVERLWCFASSTIVLSIADVNRQYRWAHIYHAEEERPKWSHSFSGDAFVLCESYGVYNGSFGHRAGVSELVDRSKLVQTYRKRHPAWKEAKIQRAVDESIAKSSREAENIRGSVAEAERISFLHSLCDAGPIVLLLSDGGTMSPIIGGTHGLPTSERCPRFHDAYVVHLSDPRIGDLMAAIPYWVPVTITAPH
jgi:hypothetical protein